MKVCIIEKEDTVKTLVTLISNNIIIEDFLISKQ